MTTLHNCQVDVNTVRLPKHRKAKIHRETEEWLSVTNVTNWPPIFIEGGLVVDGLQRVLVARKLRIRFIPAQVVKK